MLHELPIKPYALGERYDSQLSKDNEHYSDEDDYLVEFYRAVCERFGVTNSGDDSEG